MAARGVVQITSSLLLCSVKCSWLMRISGRKLPSPILCRYFSLPQQDFETRSKENSCLVNKLENMGVDIKLVRKRQPGILKKMITHEAGLADFLQDKGASGDAVASIISRYPRAITRTPDHVEKKWEIWHSILKSDSEILKVVERYPESFFRSTNEANLQKNITFLNSLGLTPKDLSQLLTKAPRTFSNRPKLNQQMVDYLHDMHVSLGGENTDEFVKRIIIKNIFVLSQSIRRVKANLEFLQSSLKLTDKELLTLLQDYGADILVLCHEYIKRNFKNIKHKLLSVGCTDEEINSFILQYPPMLHLSPDNFTDKIDCLLKTGIDVKQIFEKPRVLQVNVSAMKSRVSRLQSIGYNFQYNGTGVLDLSKTRFEAKFERLNG